MIPGSIKTRYRGVVCPLKALQHCKRQIILPEANQALNGFKTAQKKKRLLNLFLNYIK